MSLSEELSIEPLSSHASEFTKPVVSENDEPDLTPSQRRRGYISIFAFVGFGAAAVFHVTSGMPYAADMIVDFGIVDDKKDSGLYVGLVATSFQLGNLLAIFVWPPLSNIVGRFPIVIVNAFVLGVGAILVAFASNYPFVVLVRFFQGLFFSLDVMISVTLGENALIDNRMRTLMMGVFTVTITIAAISGSLLGGVLGRPVHQYPEFFFGLPESLSWIREFFIQFPFFAPSIMGGVMLMISVGLYWCMGLETHHPTAKILGTLPEELLDTEEETDCCTVMGSVCCEPVPLLILFGLTAMNVGQMMMQATFPVLFAMSAESGGYNLSNREIGLFSVVSGIFRGLMSLLGALVARCVNPTFLTRGFAFLAIPVIIVIPEISYTLLYSKALLWVVLVLWLGLLSFLQTVVGISFGLAKLNCTSNRSRVAFLMIVEIFDAVGKFPAPAIGGGLLSLGVQLGDLHLPYVVSSLGLLIVGFLSCCLPAKLTSMRKRKKKGETEETDGQEEKGEKGVDKTEDLAMIEESQLWGGVLRDTDSAW